MATSQMSEVIQQLRRTVLLHDGAGLTDGQLLEDYISRRDEAALEALVRRHGPMVWGVCRRVLFAHHDIEDAFQATFLVLVRRAASIASRELLANWLYGVAHQTALKARATAAKRRERERQVKQMPEPAAAEQGLWHDLQPLLDEELSRLPGKYRSVIVLCGLEGKTRKEAARQLGVPEGTVGGWLARARALLAKRLARHGLAVSGAALATVLAQNVSAAGVPASVVSSTIKAACLFAAGQAAATGAISVEVAALTEGMLKTMLMTKIKIATVVLFVASTVAVTCGVIAGQQQPKQPNDVKAKPQVKPAEPPQADRVKLHGTWQLVSAESDGLLFGEGRPENKDTRMVFEKSSVTIFGKERFDERFKKEPVDVKYVADFTLDPNQAPKVILLAWKESPWNGKKDFTQKAIYALEGDSLKLCLNLDEEDKKPPTELSANFGSKRRLLTFKRDPASENGGAKQQQPKVAEAVKAKPQIKPAEASKEGKNKLQGTWQMVTAEADGFRNGEGRPELKNNRLVIEESSFTLYYALNVSLNGKTLELEKAETTTSTGTFTLDTKQTPRVIVLIWKESPVNGKKDLRQKAIYAVEGDTLKLCLSGDGEKAPTEFSANAGSNRCLWTFKRAPAPVKGEKKP